MARRCETPYIQARAYPWTVKQVETVGHATHTLMRAFKIYFDGEFHFCILRMRTAAYTMRIRCMYFHHDRIRHIFRILHFIIFMEIMSAVISGPTCIDINYDIDRCFNGGWRMRQSRISTSHSPIHSTLLSIFLPLPILRSLSLSLFQFSTHRFQFYYSSFFHCIVLWFCLLLFVFISNTFFSLVYVARRVSCLLSECLPNDRNWWMAQPDLAFQCVYLRN